MIQHVKQATEINDFFGIQPINSASIQITKRCNLSCQHCYISTERGKMYQNELDTHQIKDIIDQLYQLGCVNLFFNGGEPFLHKDILELYKYASEKGFKISTSSNGYNMTESLIKEIAKFNPVIFQISIDGLEKTHDHIRNTEGSFQAAIKSLRLAVEYFKGTETNVVMATSLMQDNAKEIIKLYELAIELSVGTYAVIPILPTGKASTALDISVEEKNDIFKHLSLIFPKNDTQLSLIVPPALIPDSLKRTKFGRGYLCTFPYMLGIDSRGNIANCDGLLPKDEMILGNIKVDTIEKAWTKDLSNGILSMNYTDIEGVCAICKYLDYCFGGCRAYAYIKYGSFTKPDPICQEFYEAGLFPETALIKDGEKNEV